MRDGRISGNILQSGRYVYPPFVHVVVDCGTNLSEVIPWRKSVQLYSQFPFNVYKVSVPPFVSLRVRAKIHFGRNSKHGGTETL